MGIVSDGMKHQGHGVANEVKGKLNDLIGEATGNHKRQLKGTLQKFVGKAQRMIGRAEQKLAK